MHQLSWTNNGKQIRTNVPEGSAYKNIIDWTESQKSARWAYNSVTHCGFQHILDKCFLVFPTPQKADLIYSSNTKYLEHVIIMFKRYFSGMSQGLRVKFRLECLGRGDVFALSPGKAVITKLCVTTPSRDRRPSNDSVSINKVKCSGTL